MAITSFILSSFKTVIGIIIPPLKKKYFDQPNLYLSFYFDNSSQSPRGLSSKNSTQSPTLITEAIYNYKIKWEYKFVIRNNSEYPAYNIVLIEPNFDNNFYFYPTIDLAIPILPNQAIEYKAIFFQHFEGNGKDANLIIQGLPDKLKTGKFVLEYTNVKGTKFYTIYEGGNHKYTRKLD